MANKSLFTILKERRFVKLAGSHSRPSLFDSNVGVNFIHSDASYSSPPKSTKLTFPYDFHGFQEDPGCLRCFHPKSVHARYRWTIIANCFVTF